jgi:hypothetical protein
MTNVDMQTFRNRTITNNNWLWQPCVSTDRAKLSTLYRRPSLNASYQVSVYLARRFQRRRIFWNQPIRRKNCLWMPCLLTDQDEMYNHNRGPSIDASYQFRFIWSSGFRGGRHRQFLFLIGQFKNAFSAETTWPNELTLGWRHLWKVFYEDAHYFPIRYKIWPPQVILVSNLSISKKSWRN